MGDGRRRLCPIGRRGVGHRNPRCLVDAFEELVEGLVHPSQDVEQSADEEDADGRACRDDSRRISAQEIAGVEQSWDLDHVDVGCRC